MRRIALGLLSVWSVACNATGALGDNADDASTGTPRADVATAGRDVPSVPPRADAGGERPRDASVVPAADVPTTTPVTADPGITVAPSLGQLTARQVPTIASQPGVRAFPGAEGFGAVATGGRGGRVIYVTTLAPTGPGSLAEALAATGPRYVLFKVSGVINGSVQITQGDVTIAGQTSPGGVTVRGIHTDESNWCDSRCGAGIRGVDNVVLRHLRTRPGPLRAGDELVDGDGVRFRHSRNVMVDHVSTENAVDEAVEISYTNNITLQDCVVAETVGDHADRGGVLMNYSNPASGYQLDAIAMLRTVWVKIQGRYPEISRESPAAAGMTARIELANNLLWDQQYRIDTGHTSGTSETDGSPVYYQFNWVGNVGVTRPGFPFGMLWFPNLTGRSTVYFADDHLSAEPGRVDWQLNYCCNDFPVNPAPAKPAWALDARHPFPAVTYLPSGDVRRYVVAHAGAFPRDPMDRRLLGYVASGVIPAGAANVNPANDARSVDWAANAPPAAPPDADADGMPDAWERAHGLDPAAQDHNGTSAGQSVPGLAGYTNLEVYLAELAEQRLTEGRWGT